MIPRRNGKSTAPLLLSFLFTFLLSAACRPADTACIDTDATCNAAFLLVRSSARKSITAYSIPALNITGTISGNQITLVSNTLTSFTPQIAAFTTTGKSVTVSNVPQMSGVTSNSYSTNLTYTVTAVDGTTQDYQVTLVAPRTYGGTSLRIWLAADSLGLTDGTVVATWTDLSSFGNTFTQPTATQRPTFRTNQVNGLSAVQFRQATSQGMNIFAGGTGLYASDSGTTIIVFNWIAANALGTTIMTLEGSNGRELNMGNPNGELVPCRNGVGCWPVTNLPVPKTYIAVGGTQTGTSSHTEIWNGDLKGTRTVGLMGYGGASPGTAFISNGNLDADIAEIFFFNAALSQNETDKMFCYLRAKYSLTSTTTSCGI